jgi:hypothetical protein
MSLRVPFKASMSWAVGNKDVIVREDVIDSILKFFSPRTFLPRAHVGGGVGGGVAVQVLLPAGVVGTGGALEDLLVTVHLLQVAVEVDDGDLLLAQRTLRGGIL